MTTRGRMSRRAALRGLVGGGAAVAIGLPALEIFLNDHGTAYADGSSFPGRFGVFFWGNGVLPERWVPARDGADYELSEQLAPLAPVKDLVTVVSGLRVETGNDIPHGSGPAGILSGAPLILRGERGSFSTPSIDQVIAREIGGDTRFRSLELGAEPGEGLSYNGPDSRNPPERSPAALFERVFGGGFRAPGEDVEPDPRLSLRRSVLDAVMEDTRRLQGRLGATDRRRLDQHLTGVRELELRLARLEEDPPALASCARPAAPEADYPYVEGRPRLSEVNRVFCDVVAMALACDQTRVFFNMFTSPVNNLLFLDTGSGHHQLTHDEPDPQDEVNRIVTSIVDEFGYLVRALAAVPEGEGTLLDNTLLMATTDCAQGRRHTLDDYPVVLAGRACGRIRTGIHYRSPSSENTSKLLFSVARAFGLRLESFGREQGLVTEGLPAIET